MIEILGDFLETDNFEWLEEFFQELAKELMIPIIKVAGITHAKTKISLPIGKFVKMDEKGLII